MKNLNYIILGITAALVLGIAAYILTREPEVKIGRVEKSRKEIYNFDPEVCPGPSVKVTMADPYLRGLIEQGTVVETSMNYYKCNRLARNEVVLYRYSEFDEPVFRRVVAIQGDRFEPVYNKTASAWELKVNGKTVLGVKGERYLFGGEDPPPLELAAGQMKGKLGPGVAIVFSAFPPGDRDSGTFGAISVTDIVGKAILGSGK